MPGLRALNPESALYLLGGWMRLWDIGAPLRVFTPFSKGSPATELRNGKWKVESCLSKSLPLREGKGDRLRWMRWKCKAGSYYAPQET